VSKHQQNWQDAATTESNTVTQLRLSLLS